MFRTMRIFPQILALIASFLVLSCSSPSEPDGVFELDATVQLIKVNGGCWSLVSSDGSSFDPLGLPDAFKQDDLRVHVLLRSQTKFGSRCMVGEIVEVVSIEALNPGS